MENFDIDNMINMAKRVVEDTLSPQDKCKAKFSNIVCGIAKKYSTTKYLNREDLENDLWVKVFQMLKDFNYDVDSMDPNWVARCCYNQAVDLYRKNRYRYMDKVCRFDESFVHEDADSDSSQHHEKTAISSTLDKLPHAKFHSPDDDLIYEAIINLFEKGSKERNYVISKMFMNGLIPLDRRYMEEFIMPEDDSEGSYLVDVLKAKNGNRKVSGSWVVQKHKMKARIKYYLRLEDYTPDGYAKDLKDYIKSETKDTGVLELDYILKKNGEFKGVFNKSELIQCIKESTLLLYGIDSNGHDVAMYNDSILVKKLLREGYQVFIPDVHDED